MKRHSQIAALLAALALPAAAQAQEIAIGLGSTDYPGAGTDSGILSLEYRHSPFFERGIFSAAFAANISATEESDLFAGAGVALRWAWNGGWFVDLSVMPGYYDAGVPGNDLGSDLEFRSLLGLGYQFAGGQSLSLAITHKSNASLDNVNPGADAVLLRWHAPL
ncbi:acyloxyacyl hydrolase [Aestuariivita boseongensis]|jgi:hypothetical protein|uniref:acyloxyacyl hydrolase n=1 Tax=Aestuariivita boseongensis TaxID=1470562 RepID=UPI0006827F83|nr:acyloxyacyl hydrolase [Aestuariivita boseongensis]